MKVFAGIRNIAVAIKSIARGNVSYRAWSAWLDSERKNSSPEALVERYSSWVYTCVNLNANAVAETGLSLYTTKKTRNFRTRLVSGEERKWLAKSPVAMTHMKAAGTDEVYRLDEHPFLDLLKNVNPIMNRFDLLSGTSAYCDLIGNSYWYVEKDKLGIPVRLWLVPGQYMDVLPGNMQEPIAGYEYFGGRQTIKYGVDEIVHFMYFNPRNPIVGMSPLEAQIYAVDANLNMLRYEDAIVRKGGRPDLAIVVPEKFGILTSDDEKRVREGFRARHGSPDKAGEIALLQGGMDVKTIGVTPRDLAFMQGRKFTREEIAAAYNVPLSKLTTENVNRANAEAGNWAHRKDAILPRCRRIEEKITEQLLPMYDPDLFVVFDNPVPEDREFRLKEIQAHISVGYSTPNEERGIDGRDPIDGGDDLRGQQQNPFIGASRKQVGLYKASMSTATDIIEKMADHTPTAKAAKDRAGELLDVVREIVREQEMQIINALPEKAAGRVAKFDIAPDAWLQGVFPKDEWTRRMTERLRGKVEGIFDDGGDEAMRQIREVWDEIGEPGGMPDYRRARAALKGNLQKACAKFNDTTSQAILAVLDEGIATGASLPSIRASLQEIFGATQRHRSQLFAATESSRAAHSGSWAGYKASGVVKKVRWRTRPGDGVCDFCASLDGQEWTLESPLFEMGSTIEAGGASMSLDYEEINHPPLHPLCKCSMVPVVMTPDELPGL